MIELTELTSEMEALKAKFKAQGEKALKKGFKAFFKDNPEVESVTWTQYTPWFNDGDACVFYVREIDRVELKNREEPLDSYDDDCPESVKELSSALCDAKDVLEQVFGDHVQIKATREGFDVEEYEHE